MITEVCLQLMVEPCGDGSPGRHLGSHRGLQEGLQPQEDEPWSWRLQRRQWQAIHPPQCQQGLNSEYFH